jgi:signal transduction histidine kinase/CheY-like chemotaxis protein
LRLAGELLPARASDGAAPLAADEGESRRQRHLRQQQLKMLCEQATRSPFAVMIAVAFVATLVWPFVPAGRVVAWATVMLAFPIVRWVYSSRALRRPPQNAAAGLRFHMLSTCAGGAVVGMAALLFFESLADERRAVLTMILICWAAAAVSVLAAYARAYYAYVTPIVVQTAAAWALIDAGTSIPPGERLVASSLILFAGVILSFFVSDSERVLRESFGIRYENERLIAALEREREEVVLARDQAEAANRAKSRFLAAASHDLRQPLQAVSLYSAALTGHVEGEAARIARSINEGVMSVSALVASLLDISKLDAGVIVPAIQRVNLRRLGERLESAFRAAATGKRLEFRVEMADEEIETDPLLLGRILHNLVDNAIKYTAEGSVAVLGDAVGSRVRLTVRDTGPGIPAAERDRIFEEFYQISNPQRDRSQGLGLGLAIVRRLAALLGTEVTLRSEPGRGAQFAIDVPRVREAREARPPREREANRGAAASPRLGADVLVVDDEQAIRDAMCALLETWDCRVVAAGNFAEAERVLRLQAPRVDLIIADLRLPQYENGIDTIRRIRQRLGREVPALLITGQTEAESLRQVHDSGLPLLHKPVAPDLLHEAIREALNR